MDAVNEIPVSLVGALPEEGVQNPACNAQPDSGTPPPQSQPAQCSGDAESDPEMLCLVNTSGSGKGKYV